MIDGCSLGREHRGANLLLGFGEQPRRVRVPVAGPFDRADSLPHEDAGGVEPFEQPGVERMLGASGVCADRPEL